MDMAAPYLAAIRATNRPIQQHYQLQKASNSFPPGALHQFHLINSTGHNVLARMLRFRTAALFFRLALAQNGGPFCLLAMFSHGYGSLVRAIRRLAGVQRAHPLYASRPR